jgi:hypothetical protein
MGDQVQIGNRWYPVKDYFVRMVQIMAPNGRMYWIPKHIIKGYRLA